MLSRLANGKKEALRQQCALAERVKKIAVACQKWETAREKFASLLREPAWLKPDISHHGLSEKDSQEQTERNEQKGSTRQEFKLQAFQIVNDQKKAATTSIVGCVGKANHSKHKRMFLWDTTHRFWDKYNMAQLDVLTLEKRLHLLKRNRQDLQKKLKLCQDGITVNDDVLNDRNPLFVINGKTNFAPDSSSKPGVSSEGRTMMRRLTVVDGNHIFTTHSTR